jgi:hypothetical protein
LTAAALFFLLGVALLPYPGLQNDECLFAQPLYGPVAPEFKVRMFHRDIPLMLMTYLGTARTLIFAPVFKVLAPSAYSIRIPGLITGAATIWMFGLLLYRLGGSFAAIAGTFLLAADPSFVVTTVFDWGPVAIQHFLLVGGVLALHTFCRSGSRAMLALGFFAFGFGMWDKALFSWMLSGLVIASLLLLLRQIRRRLTMGNVLTAAAAFLVGAMPLIVYNVHQNFETFRGNAKFVPGEIWGKTLQARHALDGSGLFGYIVHEEFDESPPRPPENTLERFSASIRRIAGQQREGWLSIALLLALACLPFWFVQWRAVTFALITGLVAWLLMAATKDAGGSMHHIVLLWPVPQFLVAFCLATAIANRASHWRWVATGVIILVCVQNGLVVNQYLYNFARYGAGMSWTDAVFPLKDALVRLHPEHVNLMDWGAEFNVLALTEGKIDIRWGAEPGDRETPNENDIRLLGNFLESAPESVWLRHVLPIELNPGSADRFEKRAAERGYAKRLLEVVPDRNGREIFEIYRFVKASQ